MPLVPIPPTVNPKFTRKDPTHNNSNKTPAEYTANKNQNANPSINTNQPPRQPASSPAEPTALCPPGSLCSPPPTAGGRHTACGTPPICSRALQVLPSARDRRRPSCLGPRAIASPLAPSLLSTVVWCSGWRWRGLLGAGGFRGRWVAWCCGAGADFGRAT